jgi:AraC family transcriptional regulator
MSDAAPRLLDDDEYTVEAGRQDGTDMLASLLATATVALHTDRVVTQRCIQRAATLLGIELSPRGNATAQRSYLQGGLASWQARRLTSYIEDKLDSSIRAGDLAGLVQLSTSHFFRAFRETFSESPVAYVMKRRMLRAQELMSKSRVSLTQIALECGMCDQAHFSRTFRRIVGINPSVWRRQCRLDPVSGQDTPGRPGRMPLRGRPRDGSEARGPGGAGQRRAAGPGRIGCGQKKAGSG